MSSCRFPVPDAARAQERPPAQRPQIAPLCSAKANRFEFLRGCKDGIPVLLGFIPFALVLGAQGARKGLSPVEVPLMTGSNFAGGSEFSAIALWTSPPHLLLIVAVTFLVNSRHLLMGAALAPLLRHLPKRKVLPALFFMCDESWAMSLADARARQQRKISPAFSMVYYMGLALSLYVSWVFFTFVGAAVGPKLGDIESYGFHMAFPAVFFVLLRGMWKGFAAARPWIVSLICSVTAFLLLPGAWYVAIGALTGLISAYLMADNSKAAS